jgi:hypothetical protein
LDDLEVQQAKESAKTETERHRGLGLVFEARIVEPQFRETVAQPLVIGRIGREKAAKDHRLHRLEAGQRLGSRPAVLGDRLADAAIGDGLDAGGDEAALARPNAPTATPLGVKTPTRSMVWTAPVGMFKSCRRH